MVGVPVGKLIIHNFLFLQTLFSGTPLLSFSSSINLVGPLLSTLLFFGKVLDFFETHWYLALRLQKCVLEFTHALCWILILELYVYLQKWEKRRARNAGAGKRKYIGPISSAYSSLSSSILDLINAWYAALLQSFRIVLCFVTKGWSHNLVYIASYSINYTSLIWWN